MSHNPRWWEHPGGEFAPDGDPRIVRLQAVLAAEVRSHERRYRLVEEGAAIEIAERVSRLTAPVAENVELIDPPDFARSERAILGGLYLGESGQFFEPRGSAEAGYESARMIADRLTRRRALSVSEVWARFAELPAADREVFAGAGAVRDTLAGVAEHLVREKLGTRGALALGEALFALAEAGTIFGWGARVVAGGLEAFMEALRRQLGGTSPATWPAILEGILK